MSLNSDDIQAALKKMRSVERVEWFRQAAVIFLTNGLIVDAVFSEETGARIEQVRGFLSEYQQPSDVLAQVNVLGKVRIP